MGLDDIKTFNFDPVIRAAVDAGSVIMTHYNSPTQLKTKSDNSPLTAADLAANELICDRLKTLSDWPILSEENKEIAYSDRQDWERFWVVDPLDGTKEFLNQNGEFTVNIALVDQGEPIWGVIAWPDKDAVYWGATWDGAYQKLGSGKIEKLSPQPYKGALRLAGSRSHQSDDFASTIQAMYPGSTELVCMGSSLKFIWVAAGKSEWYLRLGPTKKWDTAAGDAIVRASGGRVVQFPENIPIDYKSESLLNGAFIGIGAHAPEPQL